MNKETFDPLEYITILPDLNDKNALNMTWKIILTIKKLKEELQDNDQKRFLIIILIVNLIKI